MFFIKIKKSSDDFDKPFIKFFLDEELIKKLYLTFDKENLD